MANFISEWGHKIMHVWSSGSLSNGTLNHLIMTQPPIEVSGLGFDVGPNRAKRTVFNNVSFTCNTGELVALMGRSGSGKSTILRILSGLVSPTRGKAYCAGADMSTLTKKEATALRRRTVSTIYQDYNLIESLTAINNVSLPLEILGTRTKEAEKTAKIALETVGLGSLSRQLPWQMSGGEQQRVAIARTLVAPGSIILADEPTGAVDEQTGNEIVQLLKLVANSGKTVLIVTHDTQIANQADRVLHLHKDGITEA